MARRINTRLRIEGTLVAQTPLHVGGFGESVDTDLPLAQNGKGKWYVPGTSIAGVLRGWCEKNFREPDGSVQKIVTELFAPRRERGKEEGHASFVLVEDATIGSDGVFAEIRDGVGIDRYHGAAADKAKFDRAILPRGTKLNFVMTVEIGARKEQDKNVKTEADKKGESKEEFELRERRTKAIFGHLLSALQREKIRFGAARTRGLGRVKLLGKQKEGGTFEPESEIKEQSLLGFENMLSLLKGGGIVRSVKDLQDAASLSRNPAPCLEIAVDWKPRLPVMVKAGYDGIGVDMLPLTSRVHKDELALCLPGSSIKGALRSHAERIVRTLLDGEDRRPEFRTKGKPNFHDQIKALPLIDELFGAKKEKNAKHERLGLGALTVDDCYATGTMNAAAWRKVETARDAKPQDEAKARQNASELWRYLREIDERTSALPEAEYEKDTSRFRVSHHVAIDRWTGGASEGALYSVLAPSKVDWEEMRLTLDFGRIEENLRRPALMLFFLTLRDVAGNRLPFGFAANRGLGEVVVEKIKIAGQGLGDELQELTKFETGGKFIELSADLKERLEKEWDTWRKSNQQS
ncbi:MAG: hypothetical protein AUG51_08925 [Acidobacteria bacterium 13_1_20CM_3_53_8]|nr:MAG: hypothetical protein AUG51_08925 [Acidobacteria bacterium 13_1_20CM_3_53_8]